MPTLTHQLGVDVRSVRKLLLADAGLEPGNSHLGEPYDASNVQGTATKIRGGRVSANFGGESPDHF